MELIEFLKQTQAEVRSEIGDRMSEGGAAYPYPETIFAEVVMQHMADVGMTFEPVACHYSSKIGNANLRLSGYSVSDEADQLDLFVSLYDEVQEITPVPDSETKNAAEQCLRFLTKCAEGRLARTMEESSDAYALAITIENTYKNLDQIRIYVLTDRQAKSKNFKSREIEGKTIKLEVMDIERLFRHWSEGKPRDELVVNFQEVSGTPLPCVYVPADSTEYSYAMTAIPGEALRFIYEKYGARLLEANVRSFLSVTGKVNKGIRETLRKDPARFMAYNNGIVVVADEIRIDTTPEGGPGISWMKGMQIVNGGQTTASLYFSKKKETDIDLKHVRVPAKIIVLNSSTTGDEEELISNISRYANSQNAVKLSDLSANKPFHVELEKLSLNTYCPDGVGRWFYERAAGSYNVMLTREGSTPARLRQLKAAIPPARKMTKTDVAKYLNCWSERPDLVSFGSQKNFEKFMASLLDDAGNMITPLPDGTFYKQLVAKAIIFRTAQKILRGKFPAFQANIVTYVMSLLASRLGSRIDLDRIWQAQDLSIQMKTLIQTWAALVNDGLHQSAAGRMVSEWAKRPECWTFIKGGSYPEEGPLPELRIQ